MRVRPSHSNSLQRCIYRLSAPEAQSASSLVSNHLAAAIQHRIRRATYASSWKP